MATLKKALSPSIEVLNKELDLLWQGGLASRLTKNSYYDYYYTGQDIKVYIEGAREPNSGPELPVVQLAYSIEQKKAPVYGHASATYDAVMRGNRLVTGAFSILTTQPNYMTRLVGQAADSRQTLRESNLELAPLQEDLENRQRYWDINKNNELAPLNVNRNLFASHPPFNMVVVIGIQPESLSGMSDDACKVSFSHYYDDIINKDYNERLIDPDSDGENRRVIQNVELVKLDMSFTIDGEILVETYSFFARDEYPLN